MNRLSSVAAMVLLLFSIPAHSQVGGSRLTKYAEPADGAKAFKIWIECVAGLDAKWARGVLETLPSTDAEKALIAKRYGGDDRCLTDSRLLMSGRSLAFSSESMRGELARYYVTTELSARGERQRIAGAATSWLSDGLAALPSATKYDRPALVAYQFAACLADDYWTEARALVGTARGTAEERAAMSALAPKFEFCLANGAKINFTLPILRLYLAEAVYHSLTHTPRPAIPPAARAMRKVEQ